MNITDLPHFNAGFNVMASCFLLAGYVCIRRGRREAHRNCMVGALACSAFFLVGYLAYHFTVEKVTRFTQPAWFRPVYMIILLTHTVLAAVIVPMIAMTVSRALRERFDRHKQIARWTWPLWMYVSVTGVIIYLLLYQIFPQSR